jgi:hypothetical protein
MNDEVEEMWKETVVSLAFSQPVTEMSIERFLVIKRAAGV